MKKIYILFLSCFYLCSCLETDNSNPNIQKEREKLVLEAYFKKNDITVISSETGLYYRTLKESEEPLLKPEDVIRVEYVGKTLYGQVFDNSAFREETLRLIVRTGQILSRVEEELVIQGEVIEGWKEILPLMRLYERKQVFIPSHLGYGNQSPGEMVPANAILVFEIEIIQKN